MFKNDLKTFNEFYIVKAGFRSLPVFSRRHHERTVSPFGVQTSRPLNMLVRQFSLSQHLLAQRLTALGCACHQRARGVRDISVKQSAHLPIRQP